MLSLPRELLDVLVALRDQETVSLEDVATLLRAVLHNNSRTDINGSDLLGHLIGMCIGCGAHGDEQLPRALGNPDLRVLIMHLESHGGIYSATWLSEVSASISEGRGLPRLDYSSHG